jgi:ParB-like chromosome segregation protein Spo0J
LHAASPFAGEPVDCVRWVQADRVVANDYNPNAVAPPEMVLLELSVAADGFTQPIVGWQLDDDLVEVVDGFHRTRVGKESGEVRGRLHGYLPVAIINGARTDRSDRIAATIRHNRARGKHRVAGMSDIVVELKKRNWSDIRIGKELGMEPDEVLRLAQIAGLAEMFTDREFSQAWDHTGDPVVIPDDDDQTRFDLEWANDLIGVDMHTGEPMTPTPGWRDRSPDSSVLRAEDRQLRGWVQRSRFRDEWFWYAYTTPMQEGRAASKDEARHEVEVRFL